jgi:hypothetical protein
VSYCSTTATGKNPFAVKINNIINLIRMYVVAITDGIIGMVLYLFLLPSFKSIVKQILL